jgi:hypothetical protein
MLPVALFRVQGIEDRSENQVGGQADGFMDLACFTPSLRHSPCSEQPIKRTTL